MQVLVVEFRIKPAFIEAFAREIADNARASLETEGGCRQFDVCRDPADASLFLLYEIYDDETAVQAHLQSAHFRQMSERTVSWVSHKTVRRCERTFP